MIQSADTTISSGGIVSGTLSYISNWLDYSPSGDAMASGNYLALKFTKAAGITKVTVQMVEGNKPETELDEDMNCVFRVASTDQVIIARAYDSTGLVQATTLSLTGLTLEAAPAAEDDQEE